MTSPDLKATNGDTTIQCCPLSAGDSAKHGEHWSHLCCSLRQALDRKADRFSDGCETASASGFGLLAAFGLGSRRFMGTHDGEVADC